eukprot:6078533-Amphidinium_carterae.1
MEELTFRWKTTSCAAEMKAAMTKTNWSILKFMFTRFCIARCCSRRGSHMLNITCGLHRFAAMSAA